MLEFQEGFFEQEVRDGFYLDVTIKTLWAAEMELLNKIAEVCNKYGLQWYAAYGTLLGAIRHEGFVPWDDDMDIWMLRKDYNKLMEVLPKELPEGYRVRGPQTEEGYEQFHTCVNNGSGISISREWLAQNHNCPFTVGLDVFPLDYLPRNKKDRELQKSIFILIGRVAQIAKSLNRGDYDKEDATMTKKDAIDEMQEGLKYIKKNYKFSLSKRLIEEEDWSKVASEVWKWANYVAMMYDEKESDYIVEYLDWTRWSYKVYPKEWFAESYGATFENFMLPIPCGYDEILRKIYSDYDVKVRKTGCHEYPFYARQLRKLRSFVADAEQCAGENGIISMDKVGEGIDDYTLPEDWDQLIHGKEKRTVVLSANNPQYYIENGYSALEELEKRLAFFENHQKELLLWWRPHSVMARVLKNIDEKMAERYMEILEKYRNAQWGICDESDNTDRAVEWCDVYYGEMNAIIQPFQNNGKASLVIDSGAAQDNELRVLESRAFLSGIDFVRAGEQVIFSNTNFNSLVAVNAVNGNVTNIIPFEGQDLMEEKLHTGCFEHNGKIYFIPGKAGVMHIYDLESGEQRAHTLEIGKEEEWGYHFDGKDLYLLPSKVENGLWKWVEKEETFVQEKWWLTVSEHNSKAKYGKISDDEFFGYIVGSNKMWITNIRDQKAQIFSLPDDQISNLCFDGTDFWYTMKDVANVVCWNMKKGLKKRYIIEDSKDYGRRDSSYYSDIYADNNRVILVSWNGNKVWLLNEKSELEEIFEANYGNWTYRPAERMPHFKVDGDQLYIMQRNTQVAVCINLNTNEIEDKSWRLVLNQKAESVCKKVMMHKSVLLTEESEKYTRDILLEV